MAESRGGFDKGQDATVQELVTKTLLALRSDIGFARNDISERDIIILLFGYPSASDRSKPSDPLIVPRASATWALSG